ncbi:Flagellar hook-associated protein 1 [Pirellulimonas nuda]|uniref:Flagellar hook-associated protein 1 n=1 Tax=Pirellulimonas nuda TaxID=2528009 RepID=A0A518DFR6_9BACT|nr:flagellar hook-associated protein FlgK [Pirellulimonas nuda]QDU90315.1 Flagellar hook-associated protein 1 [Pirellulimonas nuda]
MSLFGSLQLAGNTLRAMQIGLQVVGNNIANANTEGFIREEAVYAPAPVQRIGNLTIGLGVEVEAIVQKADRFVTDRLRDAAGDRAGANIETAAYRDLETLLGELSDSDLSTAFTSFFNSIDQLAGEPANLSLRNLVIGKGESLAREVARVASRASDLKGERDSRVVASVDEINSLAEQVQQLNLRITTIEGGGAGGSQAGGLRSQRDAALQRLSEIVGVRVDPQPSGAVNVSLGGEQLVFESQRREVFADTASVGGQRITTVRFVDNKSEVRAGAGELAGLYSARDEIIGGFEEGLDEMARSLIFEFNKLHSQGQGLAGFDQLTSATGVLDAAAPLDAAGLSFTPENGSFDLVVRNKNTGLDTTHTIQVDLNGLDGDTSLTSLAAAINAVDGVSAEVTTGGRLSIKADSKDAEFAFSGDTSGALAALGLNTFFAGDGARNIALNSELRGVKNAGKFAASLGGIDGDSENALRLGAFLDLRLEAQGGASLASQYDQLINTVATGATLSQSVADGFTQFEAALEGQQQALSGVNLDEEAIKMLSLQRTYQASARFIQTISELMDILVSL